MEQLSSNPTIQATQIGRLSSIPLPHPPIPISLVQACNNSLNSLPTFDLIPLKSDLSSAARVTCLKCKSNHLIVLCKPSCGSILNSELSPSSLACLLHKHPRALLRLTHLHFSQNTRLPQFVPAFQNASNFPFHTCQAHLKHCPRIYHAFSQPSTRLSCL